MFTKAEQDAPDEWEILIRLTGLCTGTPAEDVDVAAIDDGFFDYLCFTQGLDGAAVRARYDHGGPERTLDLTLRTGPFGDRYGDNPDGLTLDKLRQYPDGINFGPMVPRVPEVLGTSDRKIRLAPPYLLEDLPRLARRLDRVADDLVLVSRRHLRSNNSWLHNVGPLMKGRDRCTLLMHREDAGRRGIADGDRVTVTSSGGCIEVAVEVTDAIKPGVVSMPHGWGHGKPGTRLGVANRSPASTPTCSPHRTSSTNPRATAPSTESRSRSGLRADQTQPQRCRRGRSDDTVDPRPVVRRWNSRTAASVSGPNSPLMSRAPA